MIRRRDVLPWLFAGLGLGACNAILGIGDHELGEGGAPGDAAVDVHPVSGDGAGHEDAPRNDGAVRDGTSHEGSSKLPPPYASCAAGGPGKNDCGETAGDCCASLLVSGGTFERTYKIASGADGGLLSGGDSADVSDFLLDEYEATVGRFRPFVAAWRAGFRPPAGSGKHGHLSSGQGLANVAGAGGFETGWSDTYDSHVLLTDTELGCGGAYAVWSPSPGAFEAYPMSCVNRYEAYAFCVWDGGFLPSEAEWEYAAAGGDEQRRFPWGSTPPGTHDAYAIFGCFLHAKGDCDGVDNIAAVGQEVLGTGRWGQLDLAGNMFEWVLDTNAPYVVPCTDCANLAPSMMGTGRGGSFFFIQSYILPQAREGFFPDERDFYLGVRCARSP